VEPRSPNRHEYLQRKRCEFNGVNTRYVPLDCHNVAYAVHTQQNERCGWASTADNKAICDRKKHGSGSLSEVEHNGDRKDRAIDLLSITSVPCATNSEQMLKLSCEGHHIRPSGETRISSVQRGRPKGTKAIGLTLGQHEDRLVTIRTNAHRRCILHYGPVNALDSGRRSNRLRGANDGKADRCVSDWTGSRAWLADTAASWSSALYSPFLL
jgi:hypothetical protein